MSRRWGAPSAPRPDAGFSVVLVTTTILVLLILGLAMVSLVSENSGLSVHHVQSSQAFYIAQAGLEYAIEKLSADPSWGGLPAPGKRVGSGAFTIAAPDTVNENGAPLPVGRKRVIATGEVGDATRVLQIIVSTPGIAAFAGAGSAGYAGDGGAGAAATMRNPGGVAVGVDGSLFVADTENHVVRKIDGLTGTVTTVAGTGSPGWSGDGLLATAARLQLPRDVAVASNGDLFIADTGNHAIRKVSGATGLITTIAGNGAPGSSGDGGAAADARLNSPRGIAVAENGDVYVADGGNNKVRRIAAATGIITSAAGTGAAGYAGDGGLATSARLRAPEGVELAPNGDLYIADTSNQAIRRVAAATGVISSIAGTGAPGYAGDGGAAVAARLNAPVALAASAAGEIYVVERGNSVVRRFTIGGSIVTVAGCGSAGDAGDGGSATSARLSGPGGIALDASGAVYVADSANHRVRKFSERLAVVGWVETRT
jgi:streptogramin lyase